jgi:hypothetical protein
MGRTVYNSEMTSNNMMVDLGDASNGTYLMTVMGNNVHLTKTIVVKK